MGSRFMMFFFILFLNGCNGQQELEWSTYTSNFDKAFKEELRTNQVAGASYAVFDSDHLIWGNSYGMANKETNELATSDTRYLVGSVTKVFTAVAILQLSEKGLLHLDSPVSTYLPGFSIMQRFPGSDPITIRAVLTHHAGLPSDVFAHKFSENPPPFEKVLDYLNGQYTCFPVGRIKSYSNLGYALLGVVIQEVSEESYADYVQKHILTPLEMVHTGFFQSLESGLANPYDQVCNPGVELPIFDVPAGALYSTVADMTKFGQAFLNTKNPILKEVTLEEMFQLQNGAILLDLDDRSAICFDCRNKAPELGRVLEHGGSTICHRAQLYLAPDAGLGAVVLSNSQNGTLNAWKLNEQFMPAYVSQHRVRVKQREICEKEVYFTSIKEKSLENYTGHYAMPGMTCQFLWQHDHLFTTIQENSFYLVPEGVHSFVPAKRFLGCMAPSTNMWFFLEEIEEEKLFIQAMPWGDLTIVGQKVTPKPIPEKWARRVGRYKLTDQPSRDFQMITDLALVEKNGFLILQFTLNNTLGNSPPAEMALDLAREDTGFILGLGRGGGETVSFRRNPATNKEILSFGGLEATLEK